LGGRLGLLALKEKPAVSSERDTRLEEQEVPTAALQRRESHFRVRKVVEQSVAVDDILLFGNVTRIVEVELEHSKVGVPASQEADVRVAAVACRDATPAIEKETCVIPDSRADLEHRLLLKRETERRQMLESPLVHAHVLVRMERR
jgi:hypothetical protein